MNAPIASASVSNSIVPLGFAGWSSDTKQLMGLGEQHRWRFHVLGSAPLPEEPIRLGDWLIVPAEDDPTPIPARTMARIQAIFAAGIQPKGFVVVHEAPKLLKARVDPGEPNVPRARAEAHMALTPGLTSDALAAFGAAMSAMASVILPMFVFLAAAVVDPILVLVTQEDLWVEVDRWQTEDP